MLDEVGSLPYPPQRHAPREPADQDLLGPGQAEELAGPLGFPRRLAEDDPRLGIRQQPLGQSLLLGAVLARRLQVR